MTHGAPILFFTYMFTNVLMRNRDKTEHRLLSLISLCYLLLFTEEYVRNQVPIEYSPILSSLWLSSVGILIAGLCFHFLFRVTRLDRHMPRWLYPYVLYLPLLLVAVNIATGSQWISAHEFVQSGLWKVPVYNAGYFSAITGGIVLNVLYLVLMAFAYRRSATKEQRSIYKRLTIGVFMSIGWHIAFGYFNYGGFLPPYPYLYSGVIWCYMLRLTMKRYDFLSLSDKRYEKLFHLIPDAILLVDRELELKEANPAARQLLRKLGLTPKLFFERLNNHIPTQLRGGLEVKQEGIEIAYEGGSVHLLLNADYVWVDNEEYALLVLRDITAQKQAQNEILFLAYHDPLTRLPNRRYFHEQFDRVLSEAAARQESVALLLIDLDCFKLLNDTHGHIAGDEVLLESARIMQHTIGERGLAARMGGDEFIIYLRGSPSVYGIESLISDMQEQFARYMSKYGDVPVGMSIGISCYPVDGLEVQALINKADQAMFEFKRSRKSAAARKSHGA
ncbi:GGDEF domain-containing protein [Paenibacillus ginsengarvi]|uniref:GGDEF domain-containing protein n=1 Tax=Paenibacillus ginsengarvi TaxID=400777 RepID=UPI00196155B5|nr:sensor domain-containing diguanylate cyclase [Paenibacillus ginsengarvi]